MKGHRLVSTLLILMLAFAHNVQGQNSGRGGGHVNPSPSGEAGYYALVIGNNDYPHITDRPSLEKAINDVEAISLELDNLGYDVTKP